MVGLEVGQVALEEVQVLIHGVGQAQLLHQPVEGAEAATVQAARLLAQVIVDVLVREHALPLRRPVNLS